MTPKRLRFPDDTESNYSLLTKGSTKRYRVQQSGIKPFTPTRIMYSRATNYSDLIQKRIPWLASRVAARSSRRHIPGLYESRLRIGIKKWHRYVHLFNKIYKLPLLMISKFLELRKLRS